MVNRLTGADPEKSPNPTMSQVRESIQQGRPKTAIEQLDRLIESSTQSNDSATAVWGMATRASLRGQLEGGGEEERIVRFQADLENASDLQKPIMRAILAEWLASYASNNGWRFAGRTPVVLADDESNAKVSSAEDLKTWDRPKILSATQRLFDEALADSSQLQKISIQSLDELFSEPTVPDQLRPTLYDFIVVKAIEHFIDSQTTYSGPIERFEFQADTPILGTPEAFIAWSVPEIDKNSPLRRAVVLSQDWERFHANDPESDAKLDIQLQRFEFARANAVGADVTKRYVAAMQRFATEHAEHPFSTRAQYHLAQHAVDESEPLRAHQIASAAIAKHPDSFGAKQCHQLIRQIESEELSVQTERVWNPKLDRSIAPEIELTYKNLPAVTFRLIPLRLQTLIIQGGGSDYYSTENLRLLLSVEAARQWTIQLPPTADFRQKRHVVPAPTDLPPGPYALLASSDGQFNVSDDDHAIDYTQVWVSTLSMVLRTRHRNAVIDGLVTDGFSGDPIAGAVIQAFTRSEDGSRMMVPGKKLKTDASGQFEVTDLNSNEVLISVEHGGQSLISHQGLYVQRWHQNHHEMAQSVFFTDRAIYRPGQMVRYKVISVRADQDSNEYTVLPDQRYRVELVDVNGKVVGSREHRTNEHGSANGSFDLPLVGLTGQMTLRVADGPNGSASFRVEEYKRPKFEVELLSPSDPVRLEQSVTVEGKAIAYTGASIDGANVRYTVVRETNFPIWWWWRCWWMPPAPIPPQTITTGETTTNATGSFDIQFDAIPDSSVDREAEPTFRYTVTADVVDTTGETRSGQFSVTVGYTTMTAALSTDNADWLTSDEAVTVKVRTETLQGDGVSASVKLEVHSLKAPDRIGREPLTPPWQHWQIDKDDASRDEIVLPHDPNTWKTDQLVASESVQTEAEGNGQASFDLKSGFYRVKLSAVDSAGNSVTAILPLRVIDPNSKRMNLPIANVVAVRSRSLQPGDSFRAVWGSGYKTARALIEIEHRGKPLVRQWTPAGQTQFDVIRAIDESLRGGFIFRVTMVRENRIYVTEQKIEVPWTSKELEVTWQRFVSKLKPGGEETWTATIRPKSKAVKPELVEMVATLFDASLDVFAAHGWMSGFGLFYQDQSMVSSMFSNQMQACSRIDDFDQYQVQVPPWLYRDYSPEIATDSMGGMMFDGMMRKGSMMRSRGGYAMPMAAPMMMMETADAMAMGGEVISLAASSDATNDMRMGGDPPDAPRLPKVDLSDVSPRKNLNETAFFFPTLTTDADGNVTMTFTMPEALTRWRMLGFAHSRSLSAGLIDATAVTSKDLMIQPNPPRVLREGDMIEMTVKVSNQSAAMQVGEVSLDFSESKSGDAVNDRLGLNQSRQSFEIAAGQSKTLSWKIQVPDGLGFLTYKAIGSTGRLSDGEEGYLPVLSRRVLVHESIALPINGPGRKTFTLEKLKGLQGKSSIESQSLTIQMTSNPAWYAVMSLPYLMQYPHECSEQVFNRLYANLLARHIATSDPKIERVFEQWRRQPIAAGRETLASPLNQNQELTSIALSETPWVMEADSESEAKRNVGILFDKNRVDDTVRLLSERLAQLQTGDGGWSWFPGGPTNPFITLYLVTGYGRLRHLGVDVDISPAIAAISMLDQEAELNYQRIKPADRDQDHLTASMAMWLYGRSFFLNDVPLDQNGETFRFWIGQAEKHWLKLPSRMSQGHVAVALHRFGNAKAANDIVVSLNERSVTDDLGMHWNDPQRGWFWHQASIETQAMMIEVFDEVAADRKAVESCQNWLLRQKETRSWETTKATADAIYALLLRGTDKLVDGTLVDVAVGQAAVPKIDAEAGTGFYQHRIEGSLVTPDMGSITVTKPTPGIAWGGIHWQFFQTIDEVTPHADTPLQIEKQLFVVRQTDSGEVMRPINEGVADGEPLRVGDEIVSRLIIRTDRDMEFIHLRDQRGSGTEPANVLSGYRFADGLGSYHSTRDAAEHFFIDSLPRGTFVLQSRSRIQLRGDYQTGLATIESMYAPQYNSHSESHRLLIE